MLSISVVLVLEMLDHELKTTVFSLLFMQTRQEAELELEESTEFSVAQNNFSPFMTHFKTFANFPFHSHS